MKVTYNQIYKIIIYIIAVLWFVRLGHPTIYISCALTIIAFLLYLNQKDKHFVCNSLIIVYILLEFMMLIGQLFRLKISNLSTISNADLVFSYGEIFLLLLVFPMYEVICKEGISFFGTICKLVLIALIMKTMVWYLFNFQNIDIGYYFTGGSERWVRFSLGRLLYRMIGTYLDGFVLAFLIVNLFLKKSKKEKLKYILGIGLIYFFGLLITQSRVLIIYYTFTVLVGLIYYAFHTKNRTIAILTTIIMLLGILFIFKNKILDFMGSFSIDSSMGDSTQIRLLEYSYFSNLWKSTSMMWGFGLINEPVIMNGIAYWLSDLGIADILYQFGVIGLLVGIIPFLLGLIYSIRIFTLRTVRQNYFFICMTAYYLISITNVNPYRNVSYIALPFYIAYMLYITRNAIS